MRPRKPFRSGVAIPKLQMLDWEPVSKLLSLSDEAARVDRSRLRVSTELDKLGAAERAGEGVRCCGSRPSPELVPYATARGRSEVVLRLEGMSSDASTGYGARRLGDGERPRDGAGEPRALVPVLAVLHAGDGFLRPETPAAPGWLPVGLELERRSVGVAGLRNDDVGVAGLAPSGVLGRAGALLCLVGAACTFSEALDVGVDDLVGVAGRLLLACLDTTCDLVPSF